jgi:hypothetical protein
MKPIVSRLQVYDPECEDEGEEKLTRQGSFGPVKNFAILTETARIMA